MKKPPAALMAGPGLDRPRAVLVLYIPPSMRAPLEDDTGLADASPTSEAGVVLRTWTPGAALRRRRAASMQMACMCVG